MLRVWVPVEVYVCVFDSLGYYIYWYLNLFLLNNYEQAEIRVVSTGQSLWWFAKAVAILSDNFALWLVYHKRNWSTSTLGGGIVTYVQETQGGFKKILKVIILLLQFSNVVNLSYATIFNLNSSIWSDEFSLWWL